MASVIQGLGHYVNSPLTQMFYSRSKLDMRFDYKRAGWMIVAAVVVFYTIASDSIAPTFKGNVLMFCICIQKLPQRCVANLF